MAPFHPTIQPKVHMPDITYPTFYSTTSLQWFPGVLMCPPLSFQVNPPSATNPFPTPSWGDGRPPR